jgi:hypothetical protein
MASSLLILSGCVDSGDRGNLRLTDHVEKTGDDLLERIRDGDESPESAASKITDDFGLVGGKARAEAIKILEQIREEASNSEKPAIQEAIDSL